MTSKIGRGGHRYFPFVFTEQGIAMLSAVEQKQIETDTKFEEVLDAYIFVSDSYIGFKRIMIRMRLYSSVKLYVLRVKNPA